MVIVFVDPLESERVTKRKLCKLKAYSMLSYIGSGFGGIPFECNDDILDSSSFVKLEPRRSGFCFGRRRSFDFIMRSLKDQSFCNYDEVRSGN